MDLAGRARAAEQGPGVCVAPGLGRRLSPGLSIWRVLDRTSASGSASFRVRPRLPAPPPRRAPPPRGLRPQPQLQPGLRAPARGVRAGFLWLRLGGCALAGPKVDLEAKLARQTLRGQHGGVQRTGALRGRKPLLLPARRRALRSNGGPGDGCARPGRGTERLRRCLGPVSNTGTDP